MKDFSALEKLIGINFEDQKLLNKAFIHRSYLNEAKEAESNERMEFLGDAVLELVATEHLFLNHPEQAEGEMTNFRSALVKGKHLAEIGKTLKLGKYLYLSHGEENSGGREKNYILANTVEALIGAIYLDKGMEKSKKFIEEFILAKLDEIIANDLHIDSKTQFQEIAQDKVDETPSYKVLQEEGPDHNKIFQCGVYLKGKVAGKGKGSSKQNAEEAAAKDALIKKGWTK